jgi:tripartite-type tricarboxylate transporter receptor subunit TctC
MRIQLGLFLRFAAAAVALVGLTGAVDAQEWATRPVTMIVTLAPGGTNDTVARILAPRMGESLGQSVIVENVGGAAEIEKWAVPIKANGVSMD